MLRADRAFGLLVLLALASGAVLLALLATLLPRAEDLIFRGAQDAADVVAALVLLLAVFGIGLGIVTLLRQLVATAALIRTLLSRAVAVPAHVTALARQLGIADRIDIVDDRRPFSFCYWFLKPRICLSTGLLTRLESDELGAVLLHERYHLRQRDPLRLVVARYFAAGLYVIPVVEELVKFYTLEKEIEADQDAVRALGGVSPLARALYKVLPDADEVSLGLLTPVGSLSVTEARIDQLIDGRPLPLSLNLPSVLLSGGAIAAAVILAFQPSDAFAAATGAPSLIAVPGLLLAPAFLLFAAAVSGVRQQLRVVARA